ncbi:tyrosine-protein phosphatase non-receptor type 5 [Osmerus eperlanus]|uniref:tyrosine-protein phosphatase non-receptor type 5 n=1 Tax=Osmerus eperlanus TaxID=29151 RepID=UPI002E14EE40
MPRLSTSLTEDSVFRPEDSSGPLRPGDGPPGVVEGPPGARSPQREPAKMWRHKLRVAVMGLHWTAVVCILSQTTGFWAFFLVDGNDPFMSMYKALQLIDFYLGLLLSFNPMFGVDQSMNLMVEVGKTKNYWVLQATVGVGLALFVFMMSSLVHSLCSGAPWLSPVVVDQGDRRQSVSRQPSFTLSEWTDAQDELMDLEPVPQTPQTPVFEVGADTRTDAEAATLSVTPVGLQERRGSNVSLTLDMCTLGCTEPYGYGAQLSPKDQSAKEYLREGTHTLTPAQLHTRAMDDQSLQAEFYETPMNFVDPKEYSYPGLVRKNRYKTILPNTHSRVILQSEEEDFLSSYINANYLKGYGGEERAYIATQGPTVNTVGDFWRMVWQERCPLIVMITNLEEKNEKCAEYWPEDTVTHEGIEIKVVTVTQEDDYSLRVFTLKCGGEVRCLHQYWYTSWPDQKTPDKAPPLLELVQEVERAREDAPATSGPVIVHCSAGIGRTGCFIATSILCRQLRCEGVVDILKTTCQLRLDRGGMIQTCEQYQFVHHVLSLYEKQLSHTAEE